MTPLPADTPELRAQIMQEFIVDKFAVSWSRTPYVACDVPCFALQHPVTLSEYKAALDHWENHSYLHGCSHG